MSMLQAAWRSSEVTRNLGQARIYGREPLDNQLALSIDFYDHLAQCHSFYLLHRPSLEAFGYVFMRLNSFIFKNFYG